MKYRYTGPVSGLDVPERGEVVLVNGGEYDLPADSDAVRRLVKLDHLQPVTEGIPDAV